MQLKQLVGGLVIVLAFGACKKGNADLDKFMALDTAKASAFAVGGEDCTAKAKSVGEWRTKNTAEYKRLQGVLNAQWSKGPPADVIAKYGTTMKANKKAVIDAMFACSNDEAFGKMIDDTKTD